jgi:small-conductance mechanosensitive channel
MFGSDTQLVRQLLMDAAKAGKPISSAKKPTVFFTDFGENGMHFELYFWTSHNMQHARIKSDIRFEIDRLFREHGIKVPVPQREVKLESVSPEPQ